MLEVPKKEEPKITLVFESWFGRKLTRRGRNGFGPKGVFCSAMMHLYADLTQQLTSQSAV